MRCNLSNPSAGMCADINIGRVTRPPGRCSPEGERHHERPRRRENIGERTGSAGEPFARKPQHEAAHAGDRQPLRQTVSDRLRHLVIFALQGATRSTPSTPRRAGTRPSCAARPPTRAMTWSWPSAATAPSTKPRTVCWLPSRSPACPAAPPTYSGRCSAYLAIRSTPPSTCWRWPTTAAPQGGPRCRQRPLLHVRLRPWPRRERGRARRRQPAPEVALRPLVLHGGRGRHFMRRYLVRPPRMTSTPGRRQLQGVTAIVQNGAPYTYFQNRRSTSPKAPRCSPGRWPACVLHRATPMTGASIAFRARSRTRA